ncbi:MAG: amino acid ABC transporter permease [bacterium]|nr:amino acid ABC transporter permease [bacterium]
MYGMGVVVVLALVFFADWETIRRNFFNVDIAREMLPEVVTIAARNTVMYTALAFALGLVMALALALMKLSSIGPYRWFASAYIELFRGLPALITIILVGFGLPLAFGWRIPGGTLGKGSIGLGIVAAAYMAETIRAGIQAVPRGQMEAARSLGMSPMTAMIYIILPQAFRIIIPPLTNELVLLIKDTSLFFVLGSTPQSKELTKFARDAMALHVNATPLTVVAILYLAITLPLTFLVRRLELKAEAEKR